MSFARNPESGDSAQVFVPHYAGAAVPVMSTVAKASLGLLAAIGLLAAATAQADVRINTHDNGGARRQAWRMARGAAIHEHDTEQEHEPAP